MSPSPGISVIVTFCLAYHFIENLQKVGTPVKISICR